MQNINVNVINQSTNPLPAYKSKGAAGMDVCASLTQPIVLQPMQRIAVSTGLYLMIPDGYEMQVRPRSGLALNNGITCLNSPGTIDSDYRGELKIILINLGQENFTINNGDRIAQLVLSAVEQAQLIEVQAIELTERGNSGFGSTGV